MQPRTIRYEQQGTRYNRVSKSVWYTFLIIILHFDMTQRTFTLSASYLLLIVTLVHLGRSIGGWQVVIHTWQIPLWFSYIVVVVAGILALQGLKLSGKLK